MAAPILETLDIRFFLRLGDFRRSGYSYVTFHFLTVMGVWMGSSINFLVTSALISALAPNAMPGPVKPSDSKF